MIRINARLSAGSLIIAVVITLILAFFCTCLIFLAYQNRYYQGISAIDKKLGYNKESAIHYLLADTTSYKESDTSTVDLFGEGVDSVTMIRLTWGIFKIGQIRSFSNQHSDSVIFFYGADLTDSTDCSVYLSERERPLSLVGQTRLVGDAYISKSGLKPGNIGQRRFELDSLISGQVKRSTASLPQLNNEIVRNITTLLSNCKDTTVTRNLKRFTGDSPVSRSFAEPSLIFFNRGKTILEKCQLEGHIIIFSDSIVELGSEAELLDIVVVAPVVKIRENFQGRIQVIATDSLIVEDNCVLDYPSSLVLQKRDSETVQNVITIGKNCKINGVIMSLCEDRDPFKSSVRIMSGSTVSGLIYAKGYLELYANVDGSVFTDYFIVKTPSVIYENHLIDVEISRNNLSDFFILPAVFSNAGKRSIIQWVR